MSFRLDSYEAILDMLCDADDLPILTVGAAVLQLKKNKLANRFVILRHDVDRRPHRAVEMAELEAHHQVRSTYYFRCTAGGEYPEDAIRAIRELGHETGYHYECLSRSNGDQSLAIEMFRRDLGRFRKIAPCKSVAMHGAPLSRHDNGRLLAGRSLDEFELVGDAALSFEAKSVFYMTDTGGRWKAPSWQNRRDHLGVAPNTHPAPDEPEFPVWLQRVSSPVYISTHPERWARGSAGFVEAAARDVFVNLAKRAVGVFQRHR